MTQTTCPKCGITSSATSHLCNPLPHCVSIDGIHPTAETIQLTAKIWTEAMIASGVLLPWWAFYRRFKCFVKNKLGEKQRKIDYMNAEFNQIRRLLPTCPCMTGSIMHCQPCDESTAHMDLDRIQRKMMGNDTKIKRDNPSIWPTTSYDTIKEWFADTSKNGFVAQVNQQIKGSAQ